MPLYEVSLTHSFLVKIQAESENDAARLSEYFVTFLDGSLKQDREKHKFLIEDIKMTQNEAFEISQIEYPS